MVVGDYLQGSWANLEFLPESIPHLLHWDLAYLWVLSRPPEHRPQNWAERAQAWELLLQHLLSGKLEVRPQDIPLPLGQLTQKFQMDKLHLLYLPGEGEPVGILSPVCIVRPLPDSNLTALLRMRLSDADLAVASHCLNLLREHLKSCEGRVALELRSALGRLQWGNATQCAIKFYPLPLPLALDFPQADTEVQVEQLLVPVAVSAARIFVPRCSQCRTPLTNEDKPENTVDVTATQLVLACPSCGKRNTLELEKFFVWTREAEGTMEYVYWVDRWNSFYSTEPSPIEWPPEPQREDRVLKFCWNPGYLDGEQRKTTLRLRFPSVPTELSTSMALYPTLLVPSTKQVQFQGLPIRPEWWDAWMGCDRIQRSEATVIYWGIRLKGLPFKFPRVYTSSDLQTRHQLYVGVYPKQMYPEWKPYRVVALAFDGHQYAVSVPHPSGGVPYAQDSEGWPEWVAVEEQSMQEGGCGVSWYLAGDHGANVQAQEAPIQLYLGIDFGTSSTVVYYSDHTMEPKAITLAEIRRLVYWLSDEPPVESDADGWFLPSTARSQDPCLIPTALWVKHDSQPAVMYIRWAGRPPGEWHCKHGFKWDVGYEDLTPQRVRFLQEVLFFTLPCVLEFLGIRTSNPLISAAFTYPLAFSHRQRTASRKALREVESWLRNVAGFKQVRVTTLNESRANIEALGAFNPGDVFLVADLGGHTLDVALFEYPDRYHQIGSLEFGGERCLEAAVEQSLVRDYWTLRQEIEEGKLHIYGNCQPLVRLVRTFYTMALEYLRVMLAAYSNSLRSECKEIKEVKLVLAGNGWRLSDLTARDTDPDRHFLELYGAMVEKFQLCPVSVRVVDVTAEGRLRTKHLVAIGAAKYASRQGEDELTRSDPYPDKLPAGKSFRFAGKDVSWSELLGTGGLSFDRTRLDEPSQFDFQSGPQPSEDWARELDSAFSGKNRYPRPERLREWLRSVIWGERGLFLKGPLALIMERHWKKLL